MTGASTRVILTNDDGVTTESLRATGIPHWLCLALEQLPAGIDLRSVLVRCDSAGATHLLSKPQLAAVSGHLDDVTPKRLPALRTTGLEPAGAYERPRA